MNKKKTNQSDKTKQQNLVKIIWGGIVGLSIIIGAIYTNVEPVKNFVDGMLTDSFTTPDVKTDWVYVEKDSLKCIDEKNPTLELSDGKMVGFVTNQCYKDVKSKDNIGKIKEIYFLHIENTASVLERITAKTKLKPDGYEFVSQIKSGEQILVCFKYQKFREEKNEDEILSLNLYPSRSDNSKYKTIQILSIPPKDTMSSLPNKNKCPFVFGYPKK